MHLPTPANDNIADDEPLPLAEACKLFPYARLTPSTLRAEHIRGRLVIFRLGKRDYTTFASMKEMVRKCQDAARPRDSISIQNASSGLSETERVSSAQAALSQSVAMLKSTSMHAACGALPAAAERVGRRPHRPHRAHPLQLDATSQLKPESTRGGGENKWVPSNDCSLPPTTSAHFYISGERVYISGERVPSRDSRTCYWPPFGIGGLLLASRGQQTPICYPLRKVRKVRTEPTPRCR